MNDTLIAGLLFGLTYAAIVVFKRHKTQVVWAAVAVAMALGLVSTRTIFGDINWNVMGIFAGTLVLSEYFILSRVPDAIASVLLRRTKTVGMAYLAVCVFASIVSIFVENVATVLIVAPIMIGLAKRINVSPVPGIIGIAIASNLQGTATLIGDPPSMILANYMHMNFNDFFFYGGKPSIFFAVQVGAVGSMLFLYFVYNRYKTTIDYTGHVEIRSYVPAVLLTAMVVALSLAVLVDPDFIWFGGAACMVLALLAIPVSRFAHKKEHSWVIMNYDWSTTFFLMGIFVLVGMLERTGVIESLAHWLSNALGSSQLRAYLAIVWSSVGLSAIVDNVPYLTAMIPVTQIIANSIGTGTELLVFGLLIGACLGGNITPVGAAANIVAVGSLRKHDYHVGFREFMAIGLPFTIIATALGSFFVYFVWR